MYVVSTFGLIIRIQRWPTLSNKQKTHINLMYRSLMIFRVLIFPEIQESQLVRILIFIKNPKEPFSFVHLRKCVQSPTYLKKVSSIIYDLGYSSFCKTDRLLLSLFGKRTIKEPFFWVSSLAPLIFAHYQRCHSSPKKSILISQRRIHIKPKGALKKIGLEIAIRIICNFVILFLCPNCMLSYLPTT